MRIMSAKSAIPRYPTAPEILRNSLEIYTPENIKKLPIAYMRASGIIAEV
jgi:hypothetical protein